MMGILAQAVCGRLLPNEIVNNDVKGQTLYLAEYKGA